MTAETRCQTTVHEPSAWLRGVAARRVRQIEATVPDLETFGAVIAPIGRTGAPGSRADRECDRCRRYVPERDELHLFTLVVGRIHLAGGLCGRCARKEGAR
jgi:hypothetical protein